MMLDGNWTDAGGDYKWIFSVMAVMGLALGLAALLLSDGKIGAVGFCCGFGGLLLGAGVGLWLMDD